MRTIRLLALLAVGTCLADNAAWAQITKSAPAPTSAPAVQATKPAPTVQATKPAAGYAAAELAGRPDAWRYYWHNGHWWYYTAQNNWLRWNGTTWVQHIGINDSGAFSPGNMPQPNMLQPNAGNASPANSNNVYVPGNDNGGNAGQSYRYDINRRKGGL